MNNPSIELKLGNCVEVMQTLPSESIDVIYADPPFCTQQNHALSCRHSGEEYEFSDTWESLGSYLSFMRATLMECRRMLRSTGSIFLHCDRSASHHLRFLLDDILGANFFHSEIIWCYRRWSNSSKGLLNGHQTILFYSKSDSFKFHTLYTDYAATTNVDQILQKRVRGGRGKAVYARDENGEVVLGDAKRGVPLFDWWQIPYLNPKAKERVGYPTQKPILLLERILSIASDEGDLVLDPFCGSGTTLVTAKLTNRRAIGIDKSPKAIELARQRLEEAVRTDSALMRLGESSYQCKSGYESAILATLNAIPVQRNRGIDGFLRERCAGKPVPVKIQRQDETLQVAATRLLSAGVARGSLAMVLIRTHLGSEGLIMPNAHAVSDARLCVVDAADLNVGQWLRNRQEGTCLPADHNLAG